MKGLSTVHCSRSRVGLGKGFCRFGSFALIAAVLQRSSHHHCSHGLLLLLAGFFLPPNTLASRPSYLHQRAGGWTVKAGMRVLSAQANTCTLHMHMPCLRCNQPNWPGSSWKQRQAKRHQLAWVA